MTNWKDNFNNKLITIEDAIKTIKSGYNIWAGGFLSVPQNFLLELDNNLNQLQNVNLYAGLLTKPYKFLAKQYINNIKYRSIFLGPLEKKLNTSGNAELILYHLSNIKEVLEQVDFNMVVVEMTPPNEDGFMSLGACGGIGTPSVIHNADIVIGVMNENQPFVGNKENLIHIDEVSFITEGHHSIATPVSNEPSEIEKKIAGHITPLIKNGSTVQIGIGTLSNAIGFGLKKHKDLGVHTEMFTESMMELCKSGAITGAAKNYQTNKIITAFAAGSQNLIDYINNNNSIEIRDVVEVNNPAEIAKNNNFVSINTCIMTDITGQVASEGVGHMQISGSGGQVDFVRGARASKNGLSIIALSSTYKGPNGLESTIKVSLPSGTPITTLRNDVQLIATEYGIADLRGLTINERAKALINIAHPDFRSCLRDEAMTCGKL